ncbi:hypothetical protein L209DRAFT_515912 [Thermothelomyces heterothallicus CBS 203.75]
MERSSIQFFSRVAQPCKVIKGICMSGLLLSCPSRIDFVGLVGTRFESSAGCRTHPLIHAKCLPAEAGMIAGRHAKRCREGRESGRLANEVAFSNRCFMVRYSPYPGSTDRAGPLPQPRGQSQVSEAAAKLLACGLGVPHALGWHNSSSSKGLGDSGFPASVINKKCREVLRTNCWTDNHLTVREV